MNSNKEEKSIIYSNIDANIKDSKKINSQSSFIAQIERKSDFPAKYILGILGVCLMLVWSSYMELHLTNIVSIVFPVYWTVKSLEEPEPHDSKQWYSYWLIWAAFFTLDSLIPLVLKRIPFFYFFKMLFFIWLFLPSTQGALFLYETVFSHISSPYRFKLIADRLKDRINKLLEFYAGSSKEIMERRKSEHEEHREDINKEQPQKSPEEIVRDVIGPHREMEPSLIEKNIAERQSELDKGLKCEPHYIQREEYPFITSNSTRPQEDVQHESRQNIVGDAKINTDRIKTNLQDVRDQFAQSVDRLKEMRENIITGDKSLDKSQEKENRNIDGSFSKTTDKTRSQTFTEGETNRENYDPNLLKKIEKDNPSFGYSQYEKKVL